MVRTITKVQLYSILLLCFGSTFSPNDKARRPYCTCVGIITPTDTISCTVIICEAQVVCSICDICIGRGFRESSTVQSTGTFDEDDVLIQIKLIVTMVVSSSSSSCVGLREHLCGSNFGIQITAPLFPG